MAIPSAFNVRFSSGILFIFHFSRVVLNKVNEKNTNKVEIIGKKFFFKYYNKYRINKRNSKLISFIITFLLILLNFFLWGCNFNVYVFLKCFFVPNSVYGSAVVLLWVRMDLKVHYLLAADTVLIVSIAVQMKLKTNKLLNDALWLI